MAEKVPLDAPRQIKPWLLVHHEKQPAALVNLTADDLAEAYSRATTPPGEWDQYQRGQVRERLGDLDDAQLGIRFYMKREARLGNPPGWMGAMEKCLLKVRDAVQDAHSLLGEDPDAEADGGAGVDG